MAAQTLGVRQRQKIDTAINWATKNTTLLAGEWGLESDTGKAKWGDGVTLWNALPYFKGETLNSVKQLAATITSSQTWIVPPELQGKTVDVYLVGGGAGGRGGQQNAGGAGGGGGYCKLVKNIVLSAASYPLTIGIGGTGGAGSGGLGTDGGPTSGFGVTVNGGKAFTSTPPSPPSGGSGGGDGGSGTNGGDGGWGGRSGAGNSIGPGGGDDEYDPINPYNGKDYGGGGGGGAAYLSGSYLFAGLGGGNSGGDGGSFPLAFSRYFPGASPPMRKRPCSSVRDSEMNRSHC